MTPDWNPTETIVLRQTYGLKSPIERRVVVPRSILELMATWYDNPQHISLSQPMCMNFTSSLISGNPEVNQANATLAAECTLPQYYHPITGNEQPGDIFGLFGDVRTVFNSEISQFEHERDFLHSFVLAALAKYNRSLGGENYFASKLDVRKPGFHPLKSLVEIYAPTKSSHVVVADKDAIIRTKAYRNATVKR